MLRLACCPAPCLHGCLFINNIAVSHFERTKSEVCGSTRTRGYGSGTSTKSTGTGIPVLPVKNTIFHDVGAISNVVLFLPY